MVVTTRKLRFWLVLVEASYADSVNRPDKVSVAPVPRLEQSAYASAARERVARTDETRMFNCLVLAKCKRDCWIGVQQCLGAFIRVLEPCTVADDYARTPSRSYSAEA